MPRVKMESNWRRVKETIRIASWAGLSVIPVLYLTGFLTWSLHASRENLGLLPVSPVQYISVGVIVLLLVISIVGIDVFSHYLFWNLILRKKIGERLYVPLTGLAGVVAAALGAFTLRIINQWFPMFDDNQVLGATFVTLVIIFLITNVGAYYAFLLGGKGSKINSPLSYVHKNSSLLRNAINPFVVILVFSMFLLPAMSTEFGGAQERTASFDFEIGDLSENTLNDLWPNWDVSNQAGIVRTPEATVVFSNQDILMVKSLEDGNGEVIDLQRSVFKAIVWSCDEDK